MFFIYILLLIIQINLSEIDYPSNSFFDLLIDDNNKSNCIIYLGKNMSYFNISNCDIDKINVHPEIMYNKETYILNYSLINIPLNFCNYNSKDIICISEKFSSYGETLFLNYEIISYYLLFLGNMISLYGSVHYILGLIVHLSIFIYYFIKDLIDIFTEFPNENILLFIFIGAFVLSAITSYFLGTNNEKFKKVINIIYGCIFGFFLFKSIFYYIIFYYYLNWIFYLSFFFISIILGAIAGFIIINYFSYLDIFFLFYAQFCQEVFI